MSGTLTLEVIQQCTVCVGRVYMVIMLVGAYVRVLAASALVLELVLDVVGVAPGHRG